MNEKWEARSVRRMIGAMRAEIEEMDRPSEGLLMDILTRTLSGDRNYGQQLIQKIDSMRKSGSNVLFAWSVAIPAWGDNTRMQQIASGFEQTMEAATKAAEGCVRGFADVAASAATELSVH